MIEAVVGEAMFTNLVVRPVAAQIAVQAMLLRQCGRALSQNALRMIDVLRGIVTAQD